jgi:hypothetical protein
MLDRQFCSPLHANLKRKSPMKDSNFRRWLHELWLRNCDERTEYQQLPYTQQEYFRQYKYWLKREYQHQQAQVSTH